MIDSVNFINRGDREMTKWLDTVMSPEELEPYLSTTDLYSAMCVDYKEAFGQQAKTSFKAGIREVVEFIHNEFGGYTKAIVDGGKLINILIDNEYGENGSFDKWQAKLKEWGLKE